MYSNPQTSARIARTLIQVAALSIMVLVRPVNAQTDVYNSLFSPVYGHGTYDIYSVNNGNAALGFGALPAYYGASPTFQFVPTGIGIGDNLSEFKVTIGDDYFTGVKNFHLTLFTSGSSVNTNPEDWTKLGYWAGQTDGQYNSGSGTPNPSLITVLAPLTSAQLTNGNFYYLMATADTIGDGTLDWGDSAAFGSVDVWEPLLGGSYLTSPFIDSQAAFQVFVAPSELDSATPEPGTLALTSASVIMGLGAFLRRKRRIQARLWLLRHRQADNKQLP